jgi:hypothetical protein
LAIRRRRGGRAFAFQVTVRVVTVRRVDVPIRVPVLGYVIIIIVRVAVGGGVVVIVIVRPTTALADATILHADASSLPLASH